MEKLNLSRRNFVKMAVATGSIAALSSGGAATALADSGDATPVVGELKRIRTVCRACGKMECGVWVTVQDGKAMMVEGDQTCFTSQGNCCTKSQSSIQACYHPDRLRYPMKRTGAKYEDPAWERVSWDEAMEIAAKKFQEISEKYTGTGIFGMNGTSRMWAMAGYATANIITGGVNNHVASCICKGPRFLTTSTTDFYGSNWMTSGEEPDVYVEWGGNIEYSNYDDSCRNVVNASQKAKKFIIIDPRLTGIGKEADIWLNVRPGTDQAIALSWAKLIIDNGLMDTLYVKRWTVAPFLVCKDPDWEPTGGRLLDNSGYHDTKTRILKQSDIDPEGDFSKFLVLDNTKIAAGAEGNDRFSYYDTLVGQWEGEFITTDAAMTNGTWAKEGTVWRGWLPTPTQFDSIDPELYAKDVEVTLADGTVRKFTTTFQLLVEMLADKTPEWAEARTGVDAAKIKEACLAWATPLHPERGYGNGGIHISLAMDQNGMNYQTIRCIMMLVHLTGQFDTPGSNRGPTHAYINDECWLPYFIIGGSWDATSSCNFEDNAQRAGGDKWPMTRWYSQWTEPNTLFRAVLNQDPYPIVAGINDSGSFMNEGNSGLAWDGMNHLDFWMEGNLWHHPTADCADILVPVYHWMEMEFPRISQGPHCGLAADVPCVEAPGDCRSDPMYMKEFAKAMGFPWDLSPTLGYELTLHDSCVAMYERAQAESLDCNGESLPWATWDDFLDNFQKNGWVNSKEYYKKEMGTYRRYETGYGFIKGTVGNAKGSTHLNVPGCDKYRRFGYVTTTGKYEGFWPTVLEDYCQGGIANVDLDWQIPDWRPPQQNKERNPEIYEEYPFIATTGRRIPVYFHSEHRQLPWCREQWPVPRIEINPADAAKLGIEQGDWVWIETKWGKIRECADLYYGIGEGVVNLEHAWWFPELSAPNHGEKLCNCNRLLDPDNVDPIMGSPCMRGFAVKLYKATPENSPFGNPVPCDDDGTEIIHDASDPRLKKWLPDYSLNGKEY